MSREVSAARRTCAARAAVAGDGNDRATIRSSRVVARYAWLADDHDSPSSCKSRMRGDMWAMLCVTRRRGLPHLVRWNVKKKFDSRGPMADVVKVLSVSFYTHTHTHTSRSKTRLPETRCRRARASRRRPGSGTPRPSCACGSRRRATCADARPGRGGRRSWPTRLRSATSSSSATGAAPPDRTWRPRRASSTRTDSPARPWPREGGAGHGVRARARGRVWRGCAAAPGSAGG